MSVSYILDTDVLIDILRDKGYVHQFDELINKGEIFCSVLTKTEILAGMRESEKIVTEKLLDKIPHIEINYEISKKAGEYLNKYLKAYDIDIVDAVISATAKLKGIIVVTKNIKHYPMADIEIIQWRA